MSLLKVKNLSFSYELDGIKIPILRNFSLEVGDGESVAIQGPSGSGKSTLLYLIGCLLQFRDGEVWIDGSNISLLNDDSRAIFRNRNIGFVFQQFHLLPKNNVLENILLPTQYPCEFQSDINLKTKAIQLADRLGLSDRLDHFPNQLSGGQQQRVAMARALINDPKIILADEPTGNLDSTTSKEILKIFKELNEQGKTVILITHDPEVAKSCSKVYQIRDGVIVSEEKLKHTTNLLSSHSSNISDLLKKLKQANKNQIFRYLSLGVKLAPLAFENLRKNKMRSFLTMLGITIGVGSLISMITLGQFTKRKILDSYASLGVNTLLFYGHTNWELKAKDRVGVSFRYFNWERDVLPLKRIFPEISYMSPVLFKWNSRVSYGGKIIDTDLRVLGVSETALKITQRELLIGQRFSQFQIRNREAVCIIGYEIAQRLFQNSMPLNNIVQVSDDENSFGCKVIGVLKNRASNQDWMKPNLQLFIPYTFFQAVADSWDSQIRNFYLEVQNGSDAEKVGKSIKAYFEKIYGKSGRFRVDSDSVLIAQMKRFLNLFTIMLASIALISLTVGGIGIMNMMLVSVSERYREIGLRKALGATDFSIRVQFLAESVILCGFAGMFGLVFGWVSYETMIYGATKFVPHLNFEWVIDWGAVVLSVISILLVGVISGLVPAFKAEKLQVIEALRSE